MAVSNCNIARTHFHITHCEKQRSDQKNEMSKVCSMHWTGEKPLRIYSEGMAEKSSWKNKMDLE
jgi:hypothetical protein